MTWDGNGVFNRTKDWTNDRDASIKILASRHDENDDELRDGVAACLTKDGQAKPQSDFRPNADASYSLGSTTLRWIRAWISESIKWKQTNYTGTLNATTLTADRAWYLPDTPGLIVNTGVGTVTPDVVNDSMFASDASDAGLPKLINLNALANSYAGLAAFNVAASTAVAGKVELATIAETAAGTDAVRAVTPAGLGMNNLFAAQGHVQLLGLIINWVSQTSADSGTLNWTLGFNNLFGVYTGFLNSTEGSSVRITAANNTQVSYNVDVGTVPSTVWILGIGN